MPETPATLRQALRERTGPRHDALDAAMSWLDLTDRQDYARFLTIQHRARSGIEAWLIRNAPSDLTPPPATGLIAQDLAALGMAEPDYHTFAGHGLIPASALGMVWVLSGSHLGNRAMLHDLGKNGADDDWPRAFLSDPASAAYFKRLLPRLARPVTPADHIVMAGADAVFVHFLAVAGEQTQAHAA